MSAFVLGLVLERFPARDAQQLAIAVVLADAADHDGTHVFPSVARVARLARTSERTVQRALSEFRSGGFLRLVSLGGGRGKPSEYDIDVLWLSRQPSVLEKGDPGSPIRERVASIVVAPGKDDRQLLNEAIRERLKAAGVLSGQTATVETLTRKDLTSVQQLRAENYQAGDVLKAGRAYRKWGIEKGDYVRVIGGDGQRNLLRVQTASGREAEINPRTARRFQVFESGQRELQAGDRIVFRENDHPLSRKNGLAAEVLQVHGDRAIVKTETGEVQRIDFKSLRDGHWTHAYAQTAHESQGRTCDRVFVHAESNRLKLTNQQSFYVSISRAKEQAHVFTDNAEALGLAVAARSGQKTQALHASHERGAGMSL